MKLNRSLGTKKFDSIFSAATLEMIVGVMFSATDVFVTGHIVGIDGLAAMGIFTPLTAISIFVELLISAGTGMVYAGYIGQYKTDDANKAFGTGLIISIIAGVLFSLIVYISLPAYISFVGVSDNIRELILSYMTYVYLNMLIAPVVSLLCEMVYADGDEAIGAAANIVMPLLNVVISVLLGRRMGIMGIGLGTLLSTLAASLILAVHFFKKKNNLHPKLGIKKDDIREMVLFGINDEMMLLLLPVLFFIITKIMTAFFGERYLPILTVIYTIIELTIVFEASGEAMKPIVPMYLGDDNKPAIKKLAIHAIKVNILLAIIFLILMVSFAKQINAVFDMDEPYLMTLCTIGIRIYAIAFPGLSINSVFNSIYLMTGHKGLALLENVLTMFVSNVLVVPVCMWVFGIYGVWIGFAIAPYFAMLMFFTIVFLKFGKKHFPLLLDDAGIIVDTASIALNKQNIEDAVCSARDFLRDNSIDPITVNRVEFLMEEVLMETMVRNKDKKVAAEYCIRIGKDDVRLSIWDTGVIFDITYSDNEVESFRTYIISSFMGVASAKKNMVATNFNRNTFLFKLRK